MLQAREEAIIRAVHQLLAEKGFEAMTVDQVAARAGIAKASLYKHFSSKEDLAAAAMLHALQRAQAFIATLPADAPLANLRAVAGWALQRKLAGEMPTLPSQNSSLRAALRANRDCMEGLLQVGRVLLGWIEAAQGAAQINPALPAQVVLYTLFARACDPVLEFLQAGGQYDDAQIVALVLSTCFDGLRVR